MVVSRLRNVGMVSVVVMVSPWRLVPVMVTLVGSFWLVSMYVCTQLAPSVV